MRSLLEGTAGRVRAARARWVVDLVDLRELCRPGRTWVTPEEWVSVWGRDREWNGCWEVAPRRAVFKLQALLRDVAGVELKVETPEARSGMRIHVDTPAIAELVEADLLDARRIVEAVEAAREGRTPEEITAPPVVVPQLVENYVTKSHPLRRLSKAHGTSRMVLRRILAAARVRIRPTGRRRVEDVRPGELVERALRAFDAGGSTRSVAKILRCSRWSARRFLERHGRRRGA